MTYIIDTARQFNGRYSLKNLQRLADEFAECTGEPMRAIHCSHETRRRIVRHFNRMSRRFRTCVDATIGDVAVNASLESSDVIEAH